MTHQQASNTFSRQNSYHAGSVRRHCAQRRSLLVGGTSAIVHGSNVPTDTCLLADAPQKFIGPLRVCEIEGKHEFVHVWTLQVSSSRQQASTSCCPLSLIDDPCARKVTHTHAQMNASTRQVHQWQQLHKHKVARATCLPMTDSAQPTQQQWVIKS